MPLSVEILGTSSAGLWRGTDILDYLPARCGVDSGAESIETKVFNKFLDKESEGDALLEGQA